MTTATQLYGISQLPVSAFEGLAFDDRVRLFISNLSRQLITASQPLANAEFLGPEATDTRHKLAIFELEVRFACRERVGKAMTAQTYAQVVLPLISLFFISPVPNLDLVETLSQRAIELIGTRATGEVKAPYCNIDVRPM